MTSTTTRPGADDAGAVRAGASGVPDGAPVVVGVGEPGAAEEGDARRGRLPYIAAFDGLRGLAVAAVLLFHAGATWMPGGFLGVSTFFTLSGFLITSLLLAERAATGRVALGRFWSRRVRRLLPAAAATVVLVAVAGRFLLDPAQVDRLRGDLTATVLYVANWRFLFAGDSYADLFAAPSPVLHFWSLAIEEQFYLLYPLLVWGVFRLAGWSRSVFSSILAALAVASIALPFVVPMSPDRIYYGTDTRAAELLLGALLAVVVRTPAVRDRLVTSRTIERVVGLVGTAALAACVVCWVVIDQRSDGLYQGGFALYASLTCAVLLAAVMPAAVSPVALLLSLPPLRLLGIISYGVYLYHWPVFLVISAERTGWSFWPLLAVRLAVTIGLAVLSYALLEHPIRSGRRLSTHGTLVAVPAVAALLLLVTWVVVPPVDARSLVSFADAPSAPPPDLVAAPEAAPPAEVGPPTTPVPVTAPPGPQKVLVVGSPNSSAFADGFAAWAAAAAPGSMAVTTAIAECGRGRGEIGLEFRTDQSTCAGWSQAWGEQLQALKPDTVVVLLPLVNTQLMALTPEVLQREGGAVADLLSSTGAKLVTVTVPGQSRDRYGYDDMVRKVAASAGALAPAVDDLPADDPYPTLGAAVAAARPAPAPAQVAAVPRVLIIGDSVASNLGRALELWSKRTGSALVWNAAQVGCGLAGGGTTNADPPHNVDSQTCQQWRASWSDKVAQFHPDIVLVLTGAWDLPDRSRPEWGGTYAHIGQAPFDGWLLGQYQAAADTLAAGGARVVWMTAPCTGDVWAGFAIARTGAFDNGRIDALNTTILPKVQGVTLLDLHGKVCPSGTFDKNVGGIDKARPDGLHFIDDAALWVADWLGPAMLEAASGPDPRASTTTTAAPDTSTSTTAPAAPAAPAADGGPVPAPAGTG
ncbi:MAG: acyltransferase family protein [Acidimicrobiales bacterium]